MNGYLTLVLAPSLIACTSHPPAGDRSPHFPEPSSAYHHAVEARKPEDPGLVWTPAHVALVASELAPNVFAVYPDDAAAKNAAGIPAATSSGFIVGTRGVLIVDTMINRDLAHQLLALVRERTDRPILYAVNTSYHGDHSYGNQFLPRETQVIQHEATQKYIQASFAGDIAFMSRYFGSNSGLQELAPQPAAILMKDGERKDIDLGGIVVTVEHLGFAQTDGDLFVHVPSARVLYTGNPVLSGGPSFSWLLDGRSAQALATLERLKTALPPETIVVPGHGAPTGMAAIDAHIRYLIDLRSEVQAAINDGLDAARTAERVARRLEPRYGAYKIYGWVHTQVNVPRTYQELAGVR
jgi:cyclase